jgi:exonuclease III
MYVLQYLTSKKLHAFTIINTYMPTSGNKSVSNIFSKLTTTISESTKKGNHRIIILGDFNAQLQQGAWPTG